MFSDMKKGGFSTHFPPLNYILLIKTIKGLNTMNKSVSALGFMPVFSFLLWSFQKGQLSDSATVQYYEHKCSGWFQCWCVPIVPEHP